MPIRLIARLSTLNHGLLQTNVVDLSNNVTTKPDHVNSSLEEKHYSNLPYYNLYLTMCDVTGKPIVLWDRGQSGLIHKKLTIVCLRLSSFSLKALILGASTVCWSKAITPTPYRSVRRSTLYIPIQLHFLNFRECP